MAKVPREMSLAGVEQLRLDTPPPPDAVLSERDSMWVSGSGAAVSHVHTQPVLSSMPSDHLWVRGTISTAGSATDIRVVTFNIGGTSLQESSETSYDVVGAPFSNDLAQEFRRVRSIPGKTLLEPLQRYFPPNVCAITNLFFGPNFAEWSPKTRAVSGLLQPAAGVNLHSLLCDMHQLLCEGKSPIEAAYKTAAAVVITEAAHWKDHHALPKDPATGKRVENNDDVQIRANLVGFLLYMATADLLCPDEFAASLDHAPRFPSPDAIFKELDVIVSSKPHAIALQEVPHFMVNALATFSGARGYELVAPDDAKPCAALMVRATVFERPNVFGPFSSPRAVAASLVHAGQAVAIMSIHGDPSNLTRDLTGEFAAECAEVGANVIVVAGDMQIGKHPRGLRGVRAELNGTFGCTGSMPGPLGSRLETPYSVFDPQNKHFPPEPQ